MTNVCVLFPPQDTTFLDYIRGGLKLHFVVAVDFTKSNGMPNDPGSLHYLDRERQENPYIAAIRSIGEIVQDYNFGRLCTQFTLCSLQYLINTILVCFLKISDFWAWDLAGKSMDE